MYGDSLALVEIPIGDQPVGEAAGHFANETARSDLLADYPRHFAAYRFHADGFVRAKGNDLIAIRCGAQPPQLDLPPEDMRPAGSRRLNFDAELGAQVGHGCRGSADDEGRRRKGEGGFLTSDF